MYRNWDACGTVTLCWRRLHGLFGGHRETCCGHRPSGQCQMLNPEEPRSPSWVLIGVDGWVYKLCLTWGTKVCIQKWIDCDCDLFLSAASAVILIIKAADHKILISHFLKIWVVLKETQTWLFLFITYNDLLLRASCCGFVSKTLLTSGQKCLNTAWILFNKNIQIKVKRNPLWHHIGVVPRQNVYD